MRPDNQNPEFRYGTVEGGNTHEMMKRNWHHMNRYVQQNKYFRANIISGIEAIRKE